MELKAKKYQSVTPLSGIIVCRQGYRNQSRHKLIVAKGDDIFRINKRIRELVELGRGERPDVR